MAQHFLHRFISSPFFRNKKVVVAIYLIAAMLISLKIAFLETCDNYDCFKAAHFHLIRGLDLYQLYPKEYHTEYNYSPFFAMLMGIFAYLPNWMGILLWNLSNTLPFLAAIHVMPLSDQKKIFLYWFCLIEFITGVENVQTNATVTACILLVFVFRQRGKTTWSSFFFIAGFFFKIYVLTAGVFFLCYRKKGLFAAKALAWALVFFSLPLLLVSFDQLIFLYQSWITRLQVQSLRESLGVIGVVQLFKLPGLTQGWIVLFGTLAMLGVLVKKQVYLDLRFRMLYLAAILLFTVIFNPGSESPTYIIGVTGAALWYIGGARNRWHGILLGLVFIFTCLSPTELFPRILKQNYFVPYHIKAIPCILVWIVAMIELYRWRKDQVHATELV